VEAAAAGGLGLHAPAEGRLLTGVDQVAVEDLGFAACGVLVVQNSLSDQLSAQVIDLDAQASDPALQRALDGWLADGRVQLTDFLAAPEAPGESIEVEAAAEPSDEVAAPEYVRRYREQIAAQAAGRPAASEVELLRAGTGAGRARQIIATARHNALLLYPRLTAATGEALRAELQALAARGVLSVVGWGTADDREQEPVPPAPGVLEGLQRLQTSEGLPAVTVWWVGGLYGQDVVLDHRVMVSSVPNVLTLGDRRLPAGASTYVVGAADLVATALEDFEPPFARAARLSWHAAARSAVQARHALNRCCLTWVIIRRPGEALSHLLKLAAHLAEVEPAAMLVAWEALSVTLLGLAQMPGEAGQADGAAAAGALDALRRSIPEFLDWSDSALAPGGGGQTPFVAALRELMGRHTALTADGLDTLLAETRRLWREHGSPATGLPLSEAFISASDAEPKRERLKKRRY
jgi:hypothetical protein